MPILSEEDLERFRTKVCTLASSMKCDFGVERCNYSHNIYWARRCPFYLRDSSILRYVPACCPDVELGEGTTVLRNSCPRGNNCSFAHSLEEVYYHPLVYKTEVCKDYRLGKCKTYYCHLVHGLAEIRIPKQYVIPKKGNLNIPSYPNVTMVDNIRSFHSETGNFHQRDKLGKAERNTSKNEKDLFAGLTDMKISWLSTEWRTDKMDYGVDGFYLPNKSQFADGLTNLSDSSRFITDRGYGSNQIRSLSLPEYKHDANFDYIGDWPRMGLIHESKSYADTEIKPDEDGADTYGFMDTSELGISNNSNSHFSGMKQTNESQDTDQHADTIVMRNMNTWTVDQNSMVSAETNCGNENEATLTLNFNERYESEMIKKFKSGDGETSLDGMYSAVSNQCEIIKEICKDSGNNKKTWTLVVRETEVLWKLVMEVNSFLYGKAAGREVETSFSKNSQFQSDKIGESGLDISWNHWSALYSELLENIEDEKVLTSSKVLVESDQPLPKNDSNEKMKK
ncbi:conserved hypothetical protein [Theileria equi strain WA]|uniref:C3H1-type domain-containing protein n=1 Tax=Theileria equi strain WA TaxID=1537102 RepID=L1LEP0_THEEQ|nr:conserved hypothetical protein [Theileria equi strain WA]EKX73902.1 conserved hypothetical protein [Theileria equi strain WA]|eukprot:XP_004833354.1 conserved hypothetical protein [Theileria equi strain WA]